MNRVPVGNKCMVGETGLPLAMSHDEWWGCWEAAALTQEALRLCPTAGRTLGREASAMAGMVALITDGSPCILGRFIPSAQTRLFATLEMCAAVAHRFAPHLLHPFPDHLRLVAFQLGLPEIAHRQVPQMPSWLAEVVETPVVREQLTAIATVIGEDFSARNIDELLHPVRRDALQKAGGGQRIPDSERPGGDDATSGSSDEKKANYRTA